MSSLNRAQIIGNLGADPEIKTFENGDKIATFSVATTEKWKDKSTGEKKEATEWHRVVISGKLVDVIERYVQKGTRVMVEGKIKTRKYQKDGVDHYTTEIKAGGFGSNFMILTGGKGRDEGQAQQSQQSAPVDDLDDEIPF